MKPVMSFVAEMAGDIFTQTSDIPVATVVTIATQAIKLLQRCPISVQTFSHIIDMENQPQDCLAVQIEDYLVSYSIRNERILILAVENFPR